MPLAAPVTMATLPSNLLMLLLPYVVRLGGRQASFR
jgi:hypothetical protein